MKFPGSETLKKVLLSPASNRKALGALVLALAVLALFGRALFSLDTLVSNKDFSLANQFYAWREFGFSELAKGHLALWDPYLFCGAPFFAGFQSALLYPPNWLFLILPLVFALNFSIALHVFLAGFFTYLWLGANRLSCLASLFGAFVFMFGGAFFLHVYAGHMPNLCTMAWIPLIFLWVEILLDSPTLKNVLVGIAILSLQILSGHAQYLDYTFFLAGLYALFLIYKNQENRLRKIFCGLSMLLGSFALTAIQWLTTLGALGENLRNIEGSLEYQRIYSLPFVNALTVMASGLAGKNVRFACMPSRYWNEACLFIGIVAFLAALYSLARGENHKEKKWVILGLGLFALLLAFGFHTPLYPLLNQWIPSFNSFRGSYKFAIFFQLAFSFLAALGIQAWLTDAKKVIWPAHLALGLGVVFLAAALLEFRGSGLEGIPDTLTLNDLFPLSSQDPRYLEQLSAAKIVNLAGASILLLVFGLVWMARPLGEGRKYALALLGMVNLWAFGWSNLSGFNAKEMLTWQSGIRDNLAQNLGDNRVDWVLNGNRALSTRLPDIWGDDPLVPKRYNYFITYSGNPSADESEDPSAKKVNLTAPKIRLIRLMKLLVYKNGGMNLNEMTYPLLPRAFLAGRWKWEGTPQDLMNDISRPGFDPGDEVLLEKAPTPLPEENPGQGKVWLQDKTTDEVEFRVQTEKPQILMVTDNYCQGWKALAYPDSSQQTYEVMPGDYFGRAIPLSAGSHHFLMKYEPGAFIVGKWISIASLLTYFLAWGWWWRKNWNGKFISNH